MLTRRQLVSATFLLFGFVAGHNGSVAAEDVPLSTLDPSGQPQSYAEPAKRATLYVWYDDGQWHLRTRTREDAHSFSGVIRVEDGKVLKVTNFGGLEPRVKKKKKQVKVRDLGVVNEARNEIRFDFRTVGHEDGFDFQLTPSAARVIFDLSLDGYGHAERILIGRKGAHPPKAKFALPAHPQKN